MRKNVTGITILISSAIFIMLVNNTAVRMISQGEGQCLVWCERYYGPVEYIRTTTIQDELNTRGLVANVKAYVVRDKEKGFEYMVWAHHDRPWTIWDTTKNWTVQSTYESHVRNAGGK